MIYSQTTPNFLLLTLSKFIINSFSNGHPYSTFLWQWFITPWNFFTTWKQGYGNVTMWPWKVHIFCSMQNWSNVGAKSKYRRQENVVSMTLRLQRCIEVSITTSMICCKMNFSSNFETMLVYCCDLTSQYRLCEDVNLTPEFKGWGKVVNTTFIVHRELNLLSNFEATLQRCCNLDAVASTLWIGCTTLGPYRNFVTTLCVCWGINWAFEIEKKRVKELNIFNHYFLRNL